MVLLLALAGVPGAEHAALLLLLSRGFGSFPGAFGVLGGAGMRGYGLRGPKSVPPGGTSWRHSCFLRGSSVQAQLR
eukprot:4413628-Alexandrium_andersonii.AAC.1